MEWIYMEKKNPPGMTSEHRHGAGNIQFASHVSQEV
jgi:hypothetical protein